MTSIPVIGQSLNDNPNEPAIISDLICRKGENSVLNKKMRNLQLKGMLQENLYFDNDGLYNEFGDLRTVFSEKIISDVFNKNQVNLFFYQLDEDSIWRKSPIKNLQLFEGSEEKVLSISKPVFSKRKDYSLIYYEIEYRNFLIFKRGVLLYKKSNGNWQLVKEFWNGFL